MSWWRWAGLGLAVYLTLGAPLALAFNDLVRGSLRDPDPAVRREMERLLAAYRGGLPALVGATWLLWPQLAWWLLGRGRNEA